MVRASCFEVVSASVESRKLFLDGIMCLAQGVGPGVGVSSHLLEGSDLRERLQRKCYPICVTQTESTLMQCNRGFLCLGICTDFQLI